MWMTPGFGFAFGMEGGFFALPDFLVEESIWLARSNGVKGCNWLLELIMSSHIIAWEGGRVEEEVFDEG